MKLVTVSVGREVFYGIRPEHLTVAENGLRGSVAVVEPTGSETHIIVRTEGQDVTAISRERVSLRQGSAISLAPTIACAHIFDAATGVRLC